MANNQIERRLELERVRTVMTERRERRGSRVSRAAGETGKRVVGGRIEEARNLGLTALNVDDLRPDAETPASAVPLPGIPIEAQPTITPFKEAA